MNELTISELDEASVRIFSLQCAMMIVQSTESAITVEEFISTAMLFEDYIDGEALDNYTFSKMMEKYFDQKGD